MTHDDPWRVSENDYPAAGEPEEKLRFMLNYAVLAPSGHNTQPWLFGVKDGKAELRADRTRGLPVVDPEDRALVISCGAALFYLRLAMRHFGHEDVLEILPDATDADLLAQKFAEPCDAAGGEPGRQPPVPQDSAYATRYTLV